MTPLRSSQPNDPGRDARGSHGGVTSDHRLATEAGLRVLQAGGNAMDAGITMAAVLAVARPHMCGVGGDAFLLYCEVATGRVHALNASGPSGSLATIERVRDVYPGAAVMPDSGALSVSVPGAVRGWAEALGRFGTMSWRQALEPAARLAKGGLPVSERLSSDVAEEVERLRGNPEAARIYLPGGSPPAPASLLRQDDLAATFERIQANGPDEVYAGGTGRRIVEHLRHQGGFLEELDLADYRPAWVDPITTDFQGLTVVAFPPNTQGVALLEELALLRSLDVASLGHNTADYCHTLAEAIRLAFADRAAHVADPRFMKVRTADLLEPARIGRLASMIDPAGRAVPSAGVMSTDPPNTVYLIAVDQHGNAVSMIQSVFDSFGSGIVVPGTGVILHNRAALFSLDPSHPNALAPRKLPYHTLCPVLALRNGRLCLAFGTPGGDGQTQTNLQVLYNIVSFGMSPQEAIDAPRFRRMPGGELTIEDRVPESVRAALAGRGYRASRLPSSAEFGGAQAVMIEQATGALRAGADRRREAWAAAY